jgi:conjugative transfer signal peptidase TraF
MKPSTLVARGSCAGSLLLCLASFIVVLIGAAATGLRLNFTGSMPVGIYRRIDIASRVEHGDVVLVCLTDSIAQFAHERGYVPRGGSCNADLAPVGKFVMAVPGDTVSVAREGLLVNGVLLPHSRSMERDRRGRLLPRLASGPHRVEQRTLWIIGCSDLSFDSRYIGAVASTSILAHVRPVWTTVKTPIITSVRQAPASAVQR